MWPWIYGYRQYLPPDDLPEDFSEGEDDDEDEEIEWLPRFLKENENAG